MPNLSTTLLLFAIVVVLLPVETYAFGAGDIPDFSYLNGCSTTVVFEQKLMFTCLI